MRSFFALSVLVASIAAYGDDNFDSAYGDDNFLHVVVDGEDRRLVAEGSSYEGGSYNPESPIPAPPSLAPPTLPPPSPSPSTPTPETSTPTAAPTAEPTRAPTTPGKPTKSPTPNVEVKMTVAGTTCPDLFKDINKQTVLERALEKTVGVAQGKATLLACNNQPTMRSSRRLQDYAGLADLTFEIVTDDTATEEFIDSLIQKVNRISTDTGKAEFAQYVQEEAVQLGATAFTVTVKSVSGQRQGTADNDRKCDGRCIGGIVGGSVAFLLLVGLGYWLYGQRGGGENIEKDNGMDTEDPDEQEGKAVQYDSTEGRLEEVTVDGGGSQMEQVADDEYGYKV